MQKYVLTLTLLTIAYSTLLGQPSEVKKVLYGKTEIEVPQKYSAKDEYSLESAEFSAQWLYLTKEMVDQGVGKQILERFEGQIKYSKSVEIEFYSHGKLFKGKKYLLKGSTPLKYRILSLGYEEEQPLILNMGVKNDPISNDKFDDLMKQFFSLKK